MHTKAEKYPKLRHVIEYVVQERSFGLDTILGKMMSRAEQDIDSEFVTKFEAVVKDRDDHRPIFLKQAHSFRFGTGLSHMQRESTMIYTMRW
jgi:hypothetical protein